MSAVADMGKSERDEIARETAHAAVVVRATSAATAVAESLNKVMALPPGEARYRALDQLWVSSGTLERACMREAMMVFLAGVR